MESNEMGNLEFFMECDYIDDNQDLPFEKKNYLKLRVSDRTLFISPAVKDYMLPEFYTASGETIIFALGDSESKSATDDSEKISQDGKDGISAALEVVGVKKAGEIAIEKIGGKLDDLRYYLSAKELEQGKVVMNTGEIHFRKKAMYSTSIYNNEGSELFKIRRGSNFGYRKKGQVVTSKGLNQLEHFANKGISKLIPKMGKEIIELVGG